MSYILNISLIIPDTLEENVVSWIKNEEELSPFIVYRVLGSSNENVMTLSLQQKQETVQDLQKSSSYIHMFLTASLAAKFKEEINFFLSALEEI